MLIGIATRSRSLSNSLALPAGLRASRLADLEFRSLYNDYMNKTTNAMARLERGAHTWNVITPSGIRYFRKKQIAEDLIRCLEKKEKK